MLDRREPTFSAREAMVGAGVVVGLALIALIIYIGHYDHAVSQARPIACEQLGQPVNQLAADLNQAVQSAKSGPVPTDALNIDNNKLLALARANPGSFENHVKPIDDAVSQLLDDMNGASTAQKEPQVIVTITSTADAALVWCHLAAPNT